VLLEGSCSTAEEDAETAAMVQHLFLGFVRSENGGDLEKIRERTMTDATSARPRKKVVVSKDLCCKLAPCSLGCCGGGGQPCNIEASKERRLPTHSQYQHHSLAS